ncbi:MAG: regulatory protein RecX [Candidatus Dojkabacteria bacterium]
MELGKRIEKFIATRPHSRAEIENYLKHRLSLAEPELSEWLRRIEELGLSNDNAFADFWINSRLNRKSYGLEKIRAELLGKGLEPDLIRTKISELEASSEVGELMEEKIKYEIEREKSKMHGFDTQKMVQKLTRRGFKLERILKVVYN